MKINEYKIKDVLNNKELLDQLIELYLFNRNSDTLTKEEFFTPDDEFSIEDIHKLYNEKLKEYLNKLEKEQDDIVITLKKENDLIGVLFLEENFFIYDVIIKKEERQKGYSKLLLNYLIENYKDKELELFVKENNLVAIGLYEKYGFEKEQKKDNDNVLMTRKR